MQKTNFLSLFSLLILLSPLAYWLSLFISHRTVPPDWTWWLVYYVFLLAGPFLIGYGMMVYPHKQHRILAGVALAIGGGLTVYFLWLFVVNPLLKGI